MKDIKDKPDFEEALNEFMDSYAFQVPYNGTDDFYNKERLSHRPNIEREFKKFWNDYHLPALKRIEELEKQLKSNLL